MKPLVARLLQVSSIYLQPKHLILFGKYASNRFYDNLMRDARNVKASH